MRTACPVCSQTWNCKDPSGCICYVEKTTIRAQYTELLHERGLRPADACSHGDGAARDIIADLVRLSPMLPSGAEAIPLCERCSHKATDHEVDDEERRACLAFSCACEQFERNALEEDADDEDVRGGETMTISNDEYEACQNQVMLVGALVRDLPLDAFLERARKAEAVGALFAPSHWIAGNEKLDLIIKLASALRAFQGALPTLEEAQEMDARADRLRSRLGV